MLFKRK